MKLHLLKLERLPRKHPVRRCNPRRTRCTVQAASVAAEIAEIVVEIAATGETVAGGDRGAGVVDVIADAVCPNRNSIRRGPKVTGAIKVLR